LSREEKERAPYEWLLGNVSGLRRKLRKERMRATHTSNDVLTEIIPTLQQLKRMHQLNLELLEQINVSCGWILDNQIAVPNQEQITSLPAKSEALINEIQAETPKILQYQRLSDDGYHEPSNRRKVTRTPRDLRFSNLLTQFAHFLGR
jgi:hypothetical protein